jgi:solute carrier family 39 (zinc transporter), member 1/2/3
MVSLFTMIVFSGNIPYKMESFQQNPQLIAVTSAFSGGLFFAVGLIHLLPEAVEKYAVYAQQNVHENKPVPQFLCLFAFSIFLYLEKIAFGDSHHDQAAASALAPYVL